MNKDIVELINRKENQILIHSAIYYRFNDNLIPDWQYDIKLSEEFKMSYHYKDFIEYVNSDTPSGYNLPIATVEVTSKAMYLLRLYGRDTA